MFSQQTQPCLVFIQPQGYSFNERKDIEVLYFDPHQAYRGFDYFSQENIINQNKELVPSVKLTRMVDKHLLPVIKTLDNRLLDIPVYDQNNKTLLMLCAYEINDECIAYLLEHGAQPNIQLKNGMSAIIEYFQSPYLKLFQGGVHVGILNKFIEYGTDFNIQGDGNTNALELFFHNMSIGMFINREQDIFDLVLSQSSIPHHTESFDILLALFALTSKNLTHRKNINRIFEAGYTIFDERLPLFLTQLSELQFDEYNTGFSFSQVSKKQQVFEYLYKHYPFNLESNTQAGNSFLEEVIKKKNLFLMNFVLERVKHSQSDIFDKLIEYHFTEAIISYLKKERVDAQTIEKHYHFIEQIEDTTIQILLQKHCLEHHLPVSNLQRKKLKI